MDGCELIIKYYKMKLWRDAGCYGVINNGDIVSVN